MSPDLARKAGPLPAGNRALDTIWGGPAGPPGGEHIPYGVQTDPKHCPHPPERAGIQDPQEIREAYACREALEHLVVKEVMERLTPEDVQTLYQMLEGFRQAKGVEDISQASQAFDDYLYHLTGNRTLQNLLAVLKGVISRDRKYSAGSPERQKAIYQEHRAIVEALERRDLEGARQAVSRHIHNGQKYIEEKR